VLLLLKCLPSATKEKGNKKKRKVLFILTCLIATVNQILAAADNKSELFPQSIAHWTSILQRCFQNNSQWPEAVYKWEHWGLWRTYSLEGNGFICGIGLSSL